jgi:hypothetical protein
MAARKKPKGTVKCRLVVPVYDWPDPPMVDSRALRLCEKAESLEEVRAIVNRFLPKVEGRARTS